MKSLIDNRFPSSIVNAKITAGFGSPHLAQLPISPSPPSKPVLSVSEMNRLKILIADDHEIIRRGVRAILSSQTNVQIVGEASTGLQAIEQAHKLRPDVIIMDLTMPAMDGFEATRLIHGANAHIRIIVLTMHSSEIMIRNVLNAGAVGYLLKSELANKLKTALRTVCRGRQYLSHQVQEGLANQLRPALGSVPNPMTKLTSRELEVVHLLSEGQSSKEIAYSLAISVRTVETHRANSMRKLGVHSVTELLHCLHKDKRFTS